VLRVQPVAQARQLLEQLGVLVDARGRVRHRRDQRRMLVGQVARLTE
jgi:hypothetical protein